MNYQRYFKTDQQLLLKVLNDSENSERTELMSVRVVSLDEDSLLLTLPYGTDAVEKYPFSEGFSFEITSEAMGLGIRATGRFEQKIDENKFTIKLNSDLEMFQRRISKRFDCQLGIRFSRAAKTLHTMREIWDKNIKVLHSPEAPLVYEGFKSCRVNISSGGMRFSIKPPADQGELCLVLINLEDGKPPVCAIAEIVWVCMQEETAVTVGLRFINILSEDQQRIDTFISSKNRTSSVKD
ncbi:PilZ domain-containing protein [uncultured Desulfuromusa sp.]|uniref:PilZ domain-containing protein n=1 Tax=uncultured Desulfuromusa sp. TaxID=219183 RepID=UPI002AA7D6BF|nr:PilZ domain-containing protein [uncultured Desulfuromusa sp.]